MVVEKLFLEITRNCTLSCEHCLRGEKECVNMRLDTIDHVFADIERVRYLLLTGGEPLLAVLQLEKIIELIKSGKVVVDNIGIVTNGTVMSARILRILKELNELTTLRISISGDIFHLLEVERLGFTEKRNENINLLFSYFMTNIYFSEDSWEPLYITYDALGRAKKLTFERLAEINRIARNHYSISSEYIHKAMPYTIIQDTISGDFTIDVYGNVVTGSRSFIEEDEEAKKVDANLNQKKLSLALHSYNVSVKKQGMVY